MCLSVRLQIPNRGTSLPKISKFPRKGGGGGFFRTPRIPPAYGPALLNSKYLVPIRVPSYTYSTYICPDSEYSISDRSTVCTDSVFSLRYMYSIQNLLSKYLKMKTKSLLLNRGTYYQDRFMYCMYRRGENEGHLLSRSVYYPRYSLSNFYCSSINRNTILQIIQCTHKYCTYYVYAQTYILTCMCF